LTARAFGTDASDALRVIRAEANPLSVEIASGPPKPDPGTEARINARWAEIVRANPRAFNGPILAFTGFDPATNTLAARREEYKRLAVAPEIDTGVIQLGVTGLCLCSDNEGTAHALIARRAAATRAYAGLWECAPSGGLDPPPGDPRALAPGDIVAAFRKECDEELDVPRQPESVRAAALLRAPTASSVEIVLEARFDGPPDDLRPRAIGSTTHAHGWEYDDARWVPIEAIAGLVRKEPDPLTPPTAMLLAHLVRTR